MAVGSYLITGQTGPRTQPNPSDGAGPVLDAIDSAGPEGADFSFLLSSTGFDQGFLGSVLRVLQVNGMTTTTADQRYHLTDLGGKARYLVAR
jgi:hypothetical protein